MDAQAQSAQTDIPVQQVGEGMMRIIPHLGKTLHELEGILLTINLSLAGSIHPCTGCPDIQPCMLGTGAIEAIAGDAFDDGEQAVSPFADRWPELNELHLATVELQNAIAYAEEAHAEQRLFRARSLAERVHCPCRHGEEAKSESACKQEAMDNSC